MKRMNGICILTPDVDRLGQFYCAILEVGMAREGDNLSLAVAGGEITIYSYAGMEGFVPGAMAGAGAGNFVVEIEVQDVDAEHQRLTAMGVPCIKPPKSYPWGRRSAWFRDPDGNIVNFFAPTRAA